MGQYRYTPEVCTKKLSFKAYPLYVPISEGSNSVFQDICLRDSENSGFYFSEEEAYYLAVDIPQNMNYDLELTIKMADCNDKNNYQIIKKVVVPRNSANPTTNYRVCLWERVEGEVPVVTMPYELNSNKEIFDPIKKEKVYPVEGMLLYSKGNPYVYITNVIDAENYDYDTKEVSGFNDIILSASWESKSNTAYKASYEFVFSPKVASNEVKFQEIHIDMTRISEDSDIIEQEIDIDDDPDKVDMKLLCGRYLDVDNVNIQLYKINSILPPEGVDSCNRIGVWGPSGLLMAINGEPIRVGPSGYYELKDFDITSFGVFAPDPDPEQENNGIHLYQNNFTVDYQYMVK